VCLGIAYADDLAAFGFNTSLIQNGLDSMINVMKPFNLIPNGGKTQVLAFVTPRRLFPVSLEDSRHRLTIDNVGLERVDTFKYLGIHLNFLVSASSHENICLVKAKAAAVQLGRICRQLELRDLSRLQAYFISFVVSQFHGSQLVLFSNDCYETSLMLFFWICFSLPVGFP
jgi:hypothetical protein